MEELDRKFFEKVEAGFKAIAAAEPKRVRVLDATESIERVQEQIWSIALPAVSP